MANETIVYIPPFLVIFDDITGYRLSLFVNKREPNTV